MTSDYAGILQILRAILCVMVLGVMNNEGHIMQPHFFHRELRGNSLAHIEDYNIVDTRVDYRQFSFQT